MLTLERQASSKQSWATPPTRPSAIAPSSVPRTPDALTMAATRTRGARASTVFSVRSRGTTGSRDSGGTKDSVSCVLSPSATPP